MAQDLERARGWLRLSLSDVALGAVCVLSIPFIVTGLFRALPSSVPLFTPFVIVGAIAFGLWRTRSVPRAIPIGLTSGALIYGVFLTWLLMTWGSGPSIP